MRLPLIITLVAACTALAGCNSSAESSQQQAAKADAPSAAALATVPTGRLPADVKPLSYTIDFTMDPDKAAFTAHEVLAIQLTEPRDTIWFHGRGIDVTSAKLKLANGETLDVDYKQVNEAGVAKLSLPKTVSPQKAEIVLDYNDQFSQGLLGAYKVKENGDNYIFTQFEAIAARRAFPSFDEPAFKTPYTYSFTVPKGDKVVANTPVESKTDAGNGMVKWQFMTTHPLPTYLVAWAIGPLDIVEGPVIPPNDVRDRPVPLNGVTIKGKGDMIHYALKHAAEIIEAEEQYYQIPYPYHKLSLIAVPDFGAGAMENAGAVTFRGILLLMDPDTAPLSQKKSYWSVTAHELGHMWTGDLVTVPWWNDIWLNEAFATWMEQKVMMKLHPEWHPAMDVLGSRQYAMQADSLTSARAIRQPITGTGDIKNAFDGITYQKGAAVISMFEHFVGAEKFRQGMHNYLHENAYGSASLDDFLTAISKAAGQDVGPAFKTFLNQPGLPLVEATLKMQDGQPTVHLVQSRYLPVGSSGNPKAKHWDIPVCMRYAADGKTVEQCTLLTERSADIALKTDSMPDWFMPNANGIGYYQWMLGDTGYRQLTQSLDQLSPVGQMSLAGSIEAAFGAAKIDTIQAMEALAPLAASKHEAVASEPMGLIRFAHDRLVDKKTQNAVEAYARKLYSGYDVAADFKPGGAPDDGNRREFEADVAGFLVDTGQDPQVHKAANQAAMLLLGMNGNGKPNLHAIAPEFVPVALTTAVRDKGQPVFDTVKKLFTGADNPIVRRVTLRALVSATDPDLAKEVRGMIFEPGVLHKNEILGIVFGQMYQPETRAATWDWFKTNYSKLIDVLPQHFSGIVALPAVAGAFCSDKKAAEVKDFFKDKIAAYPGSEHRLKQGLERAHLCAAKREAQSASAEKFFSRQ
ncbi:MAG TPA: M1 family metallopeptidase [Gammaproteobacteria bacterium]|nr:M1 family metallopeptidase [Gammaproteobacteria bacterium]